MRLYIDPGTGSMLFTLLIGIVGAVVFLFRNILIKIKFLFSSGGKTTDSECTPIVFFTDSKRYYSIFKPLCDEMELRGQKSTYFTASEDDPILNEEYKYVTTEFIGSGNKAFAKMNLLNADIVLSSTPGLDVYQWKRSYHVKWYVHVPHMVNDITTYRMFGIDYFDAIFVSGKYQEDQIRALEKLRELRPKEIQLIGSPQLDALQKKVNSVDKIYNDIPVITVAPSWGPSSIFNRYGGKIIDVLLTTKYKIIIRPHPQSFLSEEKMLKSLMSKYPNSDRLEWDDSTDNFSTLNRTDILISDFSGVIFDFVLVFDKPIIYADISFDKGPYDAWWLDEELWTFKILPELGMQLTPENLNNIDDIITQCINSEKFKNGRKKASEETWSNKGNSIVSIADYLLMVKKRLDAEE